MRGQKETSRSRENVALQGPTGANERFAIKTRRVSLVTIKGGY